MSTDRQPWLLFEPDGTWDGLIWSPETLEEAQRKLARLSRRRWTTLAREGWTVRRGVGGEHHRLLAERLEQMNVTPAASGNETEETGA